MTRATHHWFRVAAPLLVLAVVSLCAAGCVIEAMKVSGRSQVGELPISPAGRWFDLESLAAAPDSPALYHVFSRRHLLEDVLGETAGTPPEEFEEWTAYCRELDARVQARAAALAAHDSEVRRAVLGLLSGGSTVVSPPVIEGGIRRTDDFEPFGPNRSSVTVTWHKSGVGVGETVEYRVELIQEFEEWRIDRITPSLTDPKLAPTAGGS